MTILEMKWNTRPEIRVPKVVSSDVMYRYMYVDQLDLEINACSTESSIEKISLDTTAQVKTVSLSLSC